MDPVLRELEATRRDLLDTGLRNPLISYKVTRARGVRVIDERPEEIFRILVKEGTAMSFLPKDGGDADAELPDIEEPDLLIDQPQDRTGIADRHTDTYLQTLYTSAVLHKRLLNTERVARTSLEERGVNILYLALGMVRWYESESSYQLREAPLILVPVELERADALQNFTVRYRGDDIESNLAFQTKLKSEHRVGLPDLPDSGEIDVYAYFKAAAEAIDPLPRWRIDHTGVDLGLFGFAKTRMYKDLDPAVWPEGGAPQDHPILRALLHEGFPEGGVRVSVPDNLDELVEPEQIHHILEADSSQTQAIREALAGHNLVVQGPPGTGKSQTIGNLVAELLGAGKRVLFVAEKMAALEVVKRRLDNVGLGHACLELHSQKARKRAVLQELDHVMHLEAGDGDGFGDAARRYRILRDRLNEYCLAVNEPIGQSGVSPQLAFGRFLRLQETLGDDPPELEVAWLHEADEDRMAEVRAVLKKAQGVLASIGLPAEHAFWGSVKKAFIPTTDAPAIQRAAGETLAEVRSLRSCLDQLAHRLRMPSPTDLGDGDRLLRLARRVQSAPDFDQELLLEDDRWKTQRENLEDAIRAGSRVRSVKEQYGKILTEAAWEGEIAALRERLGQFTDSKLRTLSPEYHRTIREFRSLCAGSSKHSPQEAVEILDAVLEAQHLQSQLLEYRDLLAELFPSLYKGPESPWHRLSEIAEYLGRLHADLQDGLLPEDSLKAHRNASAARELGDSIEEVEAQREAVSQALRECREAAELEEHGSLGDERAAMMSFEALETLLQSWQEDPARIQGMVSWNHAAAELEAQDLGPAREVAEHWEGAADHLSDLVSYRRCLELSMLALKNRPVLAAFDGGLQRKTIAEFRDADRELLAANRERLAARHAAEVRNQSGQLDGMRIIRQELARKRGHRPIRKLMADAGDAVQALKPVFMMSPLSVAAFLPPGKIHFDVVVFDEASQVKPEDAFGALLRAPQGIVVGDSKQLPPTAFFENLMAAEDQEDVEHLSADLESILGQFAAQGARECYLRWHYRSRHESLIAVSNREFYDNQLLIFPSPTPDCGELGLFFHHLPDTRYARGSGRYNKEEARAVVDAVMRHARESPGLSLGVATFSQPQAGIIQDLLEKARREQPELEPFFRTGVEEPFFIKNLENVQGDARDVIFISVGFGRDADGRLTMNFGPLNREGGERRLNVIITRSCRQCHVFSNFTAADMDLSKTDKKGVAALQTFLYYAEKGVLQVPRPSDRAPDSPFEEAVAEALRRHGQTVDHQVGTAGYFLDLAVRDPESPGSYLLGIECDGASYHSAAWARDRDRLRQEVLEGLGWTIHRIWSTDWFRNPAQETRRALEAIRSAAERHSSGGSPSVPVESDSVDVDTEESVEEVEDATAAAEGSASPSASLPSPEEDSSRPSVPYRLARLEIPQDVEDLLSAEEDRLAGWVRDVVDQESPVHVQEVARRIHEATGGSRIGSRIVEAVSEASDRAVSQGWIRRDGEFLWRSKPHEPTARDRSELPIHSRKLELIAPEEIQAALLQVVRGSQKVDRDACLQGASRLLGFGRMSSEIRDAMDQGLRALLEAGHVREAEGTIVAGLRVVDGASGGKVDSVTS